MWRLVGAGYDEGHPGVRVACQNNRGMAVTHILRHFCTDLWIVRQFQLVGVSLARWIAWMT
jgi:hypothetical protein